MYLLRSDYDYVSNSNSPQCKNPNKSLKLKQRAVHGHGNTMNCAEVLWNALLIRWFLISIVELGHLWPKWRMIFFRSQYEKKAPTSSNNRSFDHNTRIICPIWMPNSIFFILRSNWRQIDKWSWNCMAVEVLPTLTEEIPICIYI